MMLANRPSLKIIARCTNGVKVDAYMIQIVDTLSPYVLNVIGNTSIEFDKFDKFVLEKEKVDTLALNGDIINCKAQKLDDAGRVNLKGVGCKLKHLPSYTLDGTPIIRRDMIKKSSTAILTLTGRIIKGKETIGYTVEGIINGEKVKRNLKREVVIELAKEGKLTNARAQLNNGELLLRAVNCELTKLPIIKLESSVQ